MITIPDTDRNQGIGIQYSEVIEAQRAPSFTNLLVSGSNLLTIMYGQKSWQAFRSRVQRVHDAIFPLPQHSLRSPDIPLRFDIINIRRHTSSSDSETATVTQGLDLTRSSPQHECETCPTTRVKFSADFGNNTINENFLIMIFSWRNRS